MAKKLNHILILLALLIMTNSHTLAVTVPPHSENYLIIADSINFAGGYSTSSAYSLQDTGGETATGPSSSESYRLRAGYQTMDSSGVFFVDVPNSSQSLTPNIDVQVGGQSDLSLVWEVTSSSGYQFSIKGSDLGATEVVPEYYIAATVGWNLPSGVSAFGFSPESVDLTTTFKNDGVNCGLGSNTSNCWQGFGNATGSPLTEHVIAERGVASGQRLVTLKLRATINANSFLSQTLTGNIYATVVAS